MRFRLALMLTECHKPSFKLLPEKETGRADIGVIDWGSLGRIELIFLAYCGPCVF